MLLSKEDVMNILFNPDRSIINVLPKLNGLKCGRELFVLNRNVVKDVRDLSFDHYSPWNGKDLNGNNQKSRTEKWFLDIVNGFWSFGKAGEYVLKKLSSVHSKEVRLRREIWMLQNLEGCLQSDALLVYYAEDDLIMPLGTNNKIRPSVSTAYKDALKYRTTVSAKKILSEGGYEVNAAQLASVSRSVSCHLKKKTGPKPVSNYHEVFDRYLNRDVSEIEMEQPFMAKNAKKKVCFRCIVGFTNAFKHMSAGLPTKAEVTTHRESVQRLDFLSERDGNRHFESYLRHESTSGTLPGCGIMLIDTTFDLSAEYVTIACGYSEFFRNNRSKKNSSLILGYMIHTEKTIDTHHYFALFLEKMFVKYAPDKLLSCIIHDGEDAFKVYSQGEFLSNAVTLRCDVHRLANIKDHARNSSLSVKEVQSLFFGEKRRNSSGTTLKKGLLQSLTRTEYDACFQKVFEKMDGTLKEWLLINKNNLFNHNSMRMKLLAGYPAQYATTNVLEARNALIKTHITRKEKAERVMDTLLHLHRDEMKERFSAAINQPSSLECSDSLHHHVWLVTPTEGRRQFLSRFGLDGLVGPSKCDRLPSWVYSGVVGDIDTMMNYMDSVDVHFSSKDSNVIFLVNIHDNGCTVLKKNSEKIICTKQRCHLKTDICIHILVAMTQLPDDELKFFLKLEESRRNALSCCELLKATTQHSDGSKVARRGQPSTSRNYSRRYQYLINDSMEEVLEHAISLRRETENNDSDMEMFD